MDNQAVINHEIVELSDEDRKNGEKFHLMRYAFIWLNGELIFNDNENDDRDHQHWVLEDFGVPIEDWEKMNRGFMLSDRIQLIKGSNFGVVDTSEISVSDFQKLKNRHHEKYDSKEVTIYNGLKIGKIGEVWEPLITLGVFQTY